MNAVPNSPTQEPSNGLRMLTDASVRFTPVPAAPKWSTTRAVDLQVPGYEILGLISEGSMASVFNARQLSVDRMVAIKFLGDAHALDDEFIERFRREARLAAKLSHPNIVATIDAGEVAGRPYLVMERVDKGHTVQDYLTAHGTIAEPAAISLALGAAKALCAAHKAGLIHRDIKPANLILTPEGDVKLADLGLARPTDDAGWALAEAGMAVGTPEYISPEQVRGQFDLDIRSDIYSLGATLYHMLTGQVPFGGTTSAEALRRHVDPKTRLVPADAVNPSLTSGVASVIDKMMARSRDDRYQDPADLVLDLESLLRGRRPVIAEPDPESLIPLANGEWVRKSRPREAASVQPPLIEEPRGPSYEQQLSTLIVVAPCILALFLLAATLLIVAP